jgi:glutathione peroxidase
MPCTSCSLRNALLAAAVPVALAAGVLGIGGWSGAPESAGAAVPQEVQETPMGPNVLAQRFDLIDGTPTSLKAYEGKVLLLVNTASRCGLTPQYEGLEKLYRDFKDQGLVVIGFPANNFMGQEPGTNAEILEFCTGKYDVTFPMAAKISVKGDNAHPLYKQLIALPEPLGGEPGWNFTKFLVDRTGNVVGRFGSRTSPSDPKLVQQVRDLLGSVSD